MYLDRQWERQAYYIEPAIDSVRNVWKELNCKTPTALVEPVIRERDDLRMLEAANISIIAALTKMSLSASSI